MAITINRQVRLWDAANTVFVGDGLPLHATLARSLPTDINNLATYVEPGMQFVMSAMPDSGAGGLGSLAPRTWSKLSGESGSGLIFLDQFPLIVSPDATHLRWTFGVKRNATGPEATIAMDVTGIRLYLCPNPVRDLDVGAGNDDFRFDPDLIKYYDVRDVTVAFTSNTLSSHYGLLNDTIPGWEGFMNNVPVDVDSPEPTIVWAAVVAQVANAVTTESLVPMELSIWFGYEAI